MLINTDYCDRDTCVALTELEYNEKSNWWFSEFFNEDSGQMELVHICDNPAHLNYDSWGVVPKDFIIRPSLYEAQKWLREAKDVLIIVCPYTCNIIDKTHTWTCEIWFGDNLEYEIHDFKSYEEVLLQGIKTGVTILKDGIGEQKVKD